MKISRINKIRKYWVFQDFRWPKSLPAFAHFNLIYGWNGSGKTALSSLFALLQDKENVSDIEQEVEFQLENGAKIQGTEIRDANVPVPAVKVFNRDFVTKNIFSVIDANKNLSPIYFLGKDSAEKQKKIQVLNAELDGMRTEQTNASQAKKKATSALIEFCTDQGRSIKMFLLGAKGYENYDARDFKRQVADLRTESALPNRLSEDEKRDLLDEKTLRAKDDIAKINRQIPDVESLFSKTSELLGKKVVSQVIEELANDPELAGWVQQGLALHRSTHALDGPSICKFCENEFSQQRQEKLDGHFNDAVTKLQKDIRNAIEEIRNQQRAMERMHFPEKASFYGVLTEKANTAMAAVTTAVQKTGALLNALADNLEEKKSKLFKEMDIKELSHEKDSLTSVLPQAINGINTIIVEHNDTTQNLNKKIGAACKKFERDMVLDALPKLATFEAEVKQAEGDFSTAKGNVEKLENEIAGLENEIRQHRLPAEQLNDELCAYLGHKELCLGIHETGYALMRGGQSATNLSEGERTALAFLYFLKSLKGSNFQMQSGIVVIDDPVSSLDANALFSAFGYMKERTKECSQLFVLTHNFAFFRQVKNWFGYENKTSKNAARFYSLCTTPFDGGRTAHISRLDPLLRKFDSEYQYLFKQVHDAAQINTASTENLAQFYGMPNVARRLLEAFLAHRYPDCDGGLHNMLERVQYTPAEKTRIIRFLHTYSHSGTVEPEDDPAILGQTGAVMKAILAMMECVDKDHYSGLLKLVQTIDSTDRA